MATRICKQCGKEFEPKHHFKTICSDECRQIRAFERTKTEEYRNRINAKRRTEEGRAKARAYTKTKKWQDRIKIYKQTARYKNLDKIFRNSYEHKQKVKEYFQRPEVKLKYAQRASMRRALKRNAKIGKVDFKWINERDGMICQLCRKKIDISLSNRHPMMKSYDHIVPLIMGGEHSNRNIQLAHFTCNSQKQAKLANHIQQNLF